MEGRDGVVGGEEWGEGGMWVGGDEGWWGVDYGRGEDGRDGEIVGW